jgi:hypothetical protein
VYVAYFSDRHGVSLLTAWRGGAVNDFVVSGCRLGNHDSDGLVAAVAFGWIGHRLGVFGDVAGLGDRLGDGAPLGRSYRAGPVRLSLGTPRQVSKPG